MRNKNPGPLAVVLFAALASCGTARAATPQGNYIFSGKGAMLLNFDAAGAFSGIAAFPQQGVVNISGLLTGASGSYELHDRSNGKLLEAGPVSGENTAHGFRMVVGTSNLLSFIGVPRTTASRAPSGLFSGPLPPVEVLYQFVPGPDPQVVTLQGDQDFFVDLNRALGGQFVFDQFGRGYGVVYENSDPAGMPHRATVRYTTGGALALRVYTSSYGGKSRAIHLAKVNSGGKYDGIYTVSVVPDGCVAQSMKITVKDDVISGLDAATGALSGFVDFTGHALFSSQRFSTADGACAQTGAHSGLITYSADVSNTAFPTVMNGIFFGAGVFGTLAINQPAGPTGATTTTASQRPETWSGTLSGTHVSEFCDGGEWSETYSITLNFPSDVIAALRSKASILLSGNGSMSGAETATSQPPPQLACTYLNNTLSDTAVSVVFVGNVSPNGSVIDLQSASVLFPSAVHFTQGLDPDRSENRSAFRLHVKHISSTSLKGEWTFGTFKLTKK